MSLISSPCTSQKSSHPHSPVASTTCVGSPRSAKPRDAKKKTNQNRSQNRRQRRTRRIPQTPHHHNNHLHLHHHLLLPPPPPRPLPKPQIQTPPHRPLLLNLYIMEVEVKLRLPDTETHTKLKTLLTPFHIKTVNQQNHFFDTPTNDLSANRAVLRLRFLNNNTRAIVSLKSKPILINGVSRVEEDEEDIDPTMGLHCITNPSLLNTMECRVLKRCREEFGFGGEKGFVGLGGFENVRDVYEWRGLELEVDETKYGFGTCFEIECESEDPEGVKKELEGFLKENGVQYKYSEMTKFAVFRSGKLP